MQQKTWWDCCKLTHSFELVNVDYMVNNAFFLFEWKKLNVTAESLFVAYTLVEENNSDS